MSLPVDTMNNTQQIKLLKMFYNFGLLKAKNVYFLKSIIRRKVLEIQLIFDNKFHKFNDKKHWRKQ